MRCVVTGAAGFIGSHLCDQLLAAGAMVHGVDDLSTGREQNLDHAGAHPRFDFHRADVASPEAADLIRAVRPDVVHLLAAQMSVQVSMRDPMLDARVNVQGLLNLLLAAAESGVSKVVFAASGGTLYGEIDPASLPVTEDTVGTPSSFYGLTKRLGVDYLRLFAQHFGLPTAALALGNVYGPRQDPHGEAGVVAIFLDALRRGGVCRIHGTGETTRDYVYVDDVVAAFVAATESGRGLINVGTGEETSVLGVHRTLRQHFPTAPPAEHGPPLEGEVPRVALDTARARTELGWQARISFDEGVRALVSAQEMAGD